MASDVTPGMIRNCPCCSATFAVCRGCWRGQWYCSKTCSLESGRSARRRSNKKYKRSPQGRLAQQEAQRRYRTKLALKDSVREHSSKKSEVYLSSPRKPIQLKEYYDGLSKLCCCRCGRKITHFVDGRRFPRLNRRRTGVRKCYQVKRPH